MRPVAPRPLPLVLLSVDCDSARLTGSLQRCTTFEFDVGARLTNTAVFRNTQGSYNSSFEPRVSLCPSGIGVSAVFRRKLGFGILAVPSSESRPLSVGFAALHPIRCSTDCCRGVSQQSRFGSISDGKQCGTTRITRSVSLLTESDKQLFCTSFYALVVSRQYTANECFSGIGMRLLQLHHDMLGTVRRNPLQGRRV